MKIFVAGATGFVGSHLVPALLAAGHEVQALVRLGSEAKLPADVRKNAKLALVQGDALHPATLAGAGGGCEVFINLIGSFEHDAPDATLDKINHVATHNIVQAARRAEAKRFIQFSSYGSREMAGSEFHRTKYRAEADVKMSGLVWTILRPTYIWGKGDWFVSEQARLVKSFAPVILPDGGKAHVQPVHVDDVVKAVVNVVAEENAVNAIHEFAGPSRMTLRGLIEMIALAKRVTPWVPVSAPTGLLKPLMAIMDLVFPGFPGNRDQLVALAEDPAAPAEGFFKKFGVAPRDLTVDALRAYVA